MDAMNLSVATVPSPKHQEKNSSLILILAGIFSTILGILEIKTILLPFRFIWTHMMIGSSMPVLGLILGIMYFSLGILALTLGIYIKHSIVLARLCLLFLAMHVGILALTYFHGDLHFSSIFLLAVPVVYLAGCATNIKNKKMKETIIAYTFIAPNLIGFSFFVLVPMVFTLVLGFMQWNLADNTFTFVGLSNFTRMSGEHLFAPAIRNTLFFTFISVPLTLACSLGLALLLNQKIRGASFFRSIMFFPHVASLIAMAAVWNQIFHPTWGPVNQFLNLIGIANPPQWTVAPFILPNIILFTAWRNMGYFMIIYLAGLQAIPAELYEAAVVDGANAWRKFIHITLPQLRFVSFLVMVMLTITSFRVFDQVIMITNSESPGTSATMLVVHIFQSAFVNWDLGYASATSIVLLGLVMAVTIPQFIVQNRLSRDM